MSDNPFQPPEPGAPLEPEPELTQAWAQRELLLAKEVVAKAAAIPLFVFAAGAMLVGSFKVWVSASPDLSIGFGLMAVALLHVFVGFSVRRLQAWARVAAIVLSVGGLLGAGGLALLDRRSAFGYGFLAVVFAVPALILAPPSVGPLFTRRYARIVAATPGLRYRAPRHVWVSFALLVLGLALLIINEISHPRLR